MLKVKKACASAESICCSTPTKYTEFVFVFHTHTPTNIHPIQSSPHHIHSCGCLLSPCDPVHKHSPSPAPITNKHAAASQQQPGCCPGSRQQTPHAARSSSVVAGARPRCGWRGVHCAPCLPGPDQRGQQQQAPDTICEGSSSSSR